MLWEVCLIALIVSISPLTGQQASSFCHCDLTRSFCDYNCCCDTDCTATITTDCFNRMSSSYCPSSTFFARLGSTYLTPQGCFYYNSSSTLLEEVTLTTTQITRLTNTLTNFTRLSTTTPAVRAGYQIGDVLSIGTATSFTFVQSTGACLTATATATSFQLKLGLNMRLSCNAATTGTPLLYSEFSGKTLYQFSGDTTHTTTIPAFASATITSADIKIILGHYGSAKSRYIERVTVTTSTSTTTEKSLNIWFIEPSQLVQPGNPTFFPQLPSDIFYPVYLLS